MFSDFCIEFQTKLGGTHRWTAFQFIAKELLSHDRPIFIGETGCLRDPGNWSGDGNSTLLWQWISSRTGGKTFSVDISEKSCDAARTTCPFVRVVQSDSIKFLANAKAETSRLDLLFLDSRDYVMPYALPELHHVGELAACYDNLPSGCLIAVDDCHSEDLGKHVLVKEFFKRAEIEPVFTGYITIWRKP